MAPLWEPFRHTQDTVGGIPLKRILSLFLALCAAAALLCPSAQAAQPKGAYIAANHTKSNGKPYYIMVNRAQSTVTVYGLDEDGYYTVPVKAMICSTGRKGHATPAGTFTIGGRWTWLRMVDSSYGQYATQIQGNILFHSVCYTKRDPSALMTEEYNGLGAPASLGCVRLQTVDAKWIYDNCARGTKVTIYDDPDSPGPLGKPDKLVSNISPEQDNGWDPTDPRPENPWHEAVPYGDVLPGAWYYEDVQYVLAAGVMTGTSAAVFSPDAPVTYRGMAQVLYRMSGGGEEDAFRWAVDHRLLDGMTGKGFDADGSISRQALVTLLYRYETVYRGREAEGLASLSQFKDAPSVRAYAKSAMQWAVGNSLIQGSSSGTIHPAGQASRAQLAAILHRYGELDG